MKKISDFDNAKEVIEGKFNIKYKQRVFYLFKYFNPEKTEEIKILEKN